jgi:hypothetical protein
MEKKHDTCGQDFSPGGSRGLHLFGNGGPDQHYAERRPNALVQDKLR